MPESAYQNRSVPENATGDAPERSNLPTALHPDLRAAFARLEESFRQDTRCLGLYLRGSASDGNTADAHSDIDACVVVSEADYPAFKRGLRGICDTCCGETLGWLCKSERESYTDYSFLFGAATGDALLAFDLSVNTPAALTVFPVAHDQFVFDHTGQWLAATRPIPPVPAPYTAEEVVQAVTEYWSILYLHGKYLWRGDALRLLYVQRRLLELHVRILNAAIAPSVRWVWWAKDAAGMPEERRNTLLAYGSGVETAGAVAAALPGHMARFAADSREACEQCGAEYPAELERRVCRSITSAISAVSHNRSTAGESIEE